MVSATILSTDNCLLTEKTKKANGVFYRADRWADELGVNYDLSYGG